MLGRPNWIVSVTHIPSGIVVTRDSNHYRNQHLAKEEAIKYLKSKLAYAYKCIPQEDFSFNYDIPDDDMYPRDPKQYRREVE